MKLRIATGWEFARGILGAISAVSLFRRSMERAGTSGCLAGVSAMRKAARHQVTAVPKRVLIHMRAQARIPSTIFASYTDVSFSLRPLWSQVSL